MDQLGYQSCLADPDLWFRVSKSDNGSILYVYILLYVDDYIVVIEHPDQVLTWLGKYFPLKPESVGPPKLYLGGKFFKIDLHNGVAAWTISASKYIQSTLNNIEGVLKKHGLSLRKGTNSLLPGSYRVGCDLTLECDTSDARVYVSLIGRLRWLVESGHVDISYKVSMMSFHTALPR